MVNFGIGFTDVFVSVWSVVMAVNHLPDFYFLYPASHDKQREIDTSFCKASSFGFDNCAGAIDSILVWTHLPAEKNVGEDIGRRSFLCACKGKFGLNMQAVSDKRGQNLDMSIKCDGSSSDCLAFEASVLYS
jgi:hypothetical protein